MEPQAAPAEEHQEGPTTPRTVNRCRPVSGSRSAAPVERAAVGVGAVEVRPVRVRAHRRRCRFKRAPAKRENGLNQQDQRGGYGDVEQNVVQGRGIATRLP